MSITELDYPLLKECLEHRPDGWKNFVDRFLGLVLHAIDQTACARRIDLSPEERCDLCEAVFRALCYNDSELLRRFSYASSVSAYLTVLVRRLVIAFLTYEDEGDYGS